MPTPEPGREDRFELPSALRKLIIPRDRLPAGSQGPELDPAAVERALAAQSLALSMARTILETAMADPAADPALAEAARGEDLADIRSLTPTGAAVAAAFSATPADAAVDIWVHVRGLPFAVAAFCVYAPMNRASWENQHLRRAHRPHLDSQRSTAVRRLLEYVRTASDEEYTASMAAAEEARGLDTSGMARAIALFLFPDRHDWQAEDLPEFRKRVAGTDYAMILSVLGADATAELIERFDEFYEENQEATWMRHTSQDLEQILRLVSWLPTDEAMRALIDRSEHKLVGPVLVAAAKRFPRRAVRLLAEAKPAKTVTGVLRLQVLSDPELATAVLPDLGAAARGRVEAVLAARATHPVATADRLPAVLATPPWLERIAASGRADVAAVAAAEYGAEAGAAVAATLADDGLHQLPRVMPALPAWAEPATLPPIVLADRSAALPDEAVRAVVQMLAISKSGVRYAGLAHVAAACDSASLAAFAWELFRGWELAGASSKDRWAYEGLAVFGDDDTVLRLVPLIRSWPKENFVKRAIDGLDILAALGSNAALSALNELGLKGKPPRLRKYAASRVEAAAENLGLSAEQLADRIVPDLGLAPDGSLRLDYGPRQFVVGFDEQLKPFVTDEAGKRLKALPKPGVKDDAIPAQAAYQQFSALKKAARTLAAEQIGRLERAMCGRRSWSAEEFEGLLLGHPLLRHLVRRLVWTAFDAAPDSGGSVVGTFRVAEDLSLADVQDEAYRLPEGAVVAIAHPLDLGDSAPAWSDVFADYELLQPFQQLGRPVFELSDAERTATVLTRFAGRPASPFRIAALERRGWRRGAVEDGGFWDDVMRPLPGGWELVAQFTPGIAAWGLDGAGAQDISEVWIRTAGSRFSSPTGSGVALSVLDPVVASEVLRDLTEVMEE